MRRLLRQILVVAQANFNVFEERSANADAISRLNAAIDLLQSLPDTPKRAHQELPLYILVGPALIATRGNAAPQVQNTYERALDLCRRHGETSQLFPVLFGLRSFYLVKGQLQAAHRLGEQLLDLANSLGDTDLLLETHLALGNTFFMLGEHMPAQAHLEQGIALYDPHHHRSHAVSYGVDPGLMCRAFSARVLWMLGYPDQALRRAQATMSLAEDLNHSFSLAYSFIFGATLHQFLRDQTATYKWAEAAITLSNEQGFSAYAAMGQIFAGWALSEQGRTEAGFAQMHQGLTRLHDTGAALWRPYFFALLAEMFGKTGRVQDGLRVVGEAQALIDETSERLWEAELYRLKGELVLRQDASNDTEVRSSFERAIEIARKQSAKSLELRTTMSLARLLRDTGRRGEACTTLTQIYNWFTEGFDTADLKEAKALLQELGA